MDKYLEVELLGCMVDLFIISWGTSVLFSIVAAIYILTDRALGFPFLHVLVSTCYLLTCLPFYSWGRWGLKLSITLPQELGARRGAPGLGGGPFPPVHQISRQMPTSCRALPWPPYVTPAFLLTRNIHKFKVYHIIWSCICEMITEIRWVNTSIPSHNYCFFFCGENVEGLLLP